MFEPETSGPVPSEQVRWFEPVAIVGRACVLPGALTPAELWQAVVEGRDLLTAVPPGRWRLAPEHVLCAPDAASGADRTWSDRGGYVRGFERVWNPDGFAVPAAELDGLDPLAHWVLHTAREALRGTSARGRVGAVFGNLGFPTERMAAFAAQVWTGIDAGIDPRNRFMSAGTAELLARALALDAGSHCLDAACASSLYAIKLACDRLHDRSADVMLAGAVQRADDLFLHVGFCALSALSRTGRSLPFHRDADGLVPAEGAAFVALKRLADARRDGDTIHGVVRGIGLSNDGRGKGLLAPAEEGQARAIRAAYAASGIAPEDVALLECHATGTPVGDATELRSSAGVFAAARDVPVGSLKSNLGHLITAAGAAGLIKVLEAMRARTRPPTLHVDSTHGNALNPALDGTPFRVLTHAEPWPSERPRIAAISAFGFGGNNAHLIVSEDDPALDAPDVARATTVATPVAIVGVGTIVARAPDRAAFADAIFSNASLLDEHGEGRTAELTLDLDGLRFPPSDLAQTLPQQLAMLAVAREALAETTPLPRERTAVVVGMEPDAEVARYGLRWRLAARNAPPDWIAAAREAVVPVLEAAGVVGNMPNIPANRLGAQFDFGGPAFTVQAGAASGRVALALAARAIAAGETDAALVGAVDFACEPVHRAASGATPGDAAVAFVLKRLDLAERDGDRVYALVEPATADDSPIDDLAARIGTPGAATAMVHAAGVALALHHRRRLGGMPWLGSTPRRVALGDVALVEAPYPRRSEHALPRLHVFAGGDKAAVVDALKSDRRGDAGDARLVLVADDEDLPALRERALAHIERGAPAVPGIHFRERPLRGELAFAFAGAGASYRGMGRDLLVHFPQLTARLARRSAKLPAALDWSFVAADAPPSVFEQLCGSSALSQLHVELTEGVLGLRADAWLGYSSGETNALIAAGVWNDPDELMSDMQASGFLERELAGRFDVLERLWGEPAHWACWTVLAPIAEVEAVLEALDRVHVAIVNGPEDVLIAGDARQCGLAVARLGAQRCIPLDYPLVVHVPELRDVAPAWLRLHERATSAPRHGRVYSSAGGASYAPTAQACAKAILDQATATLDVRRVVERAYADGVRVFVEHGPGGTFGRAIRNVLGARDALVVSLDRRTQGLDAILNAAAALVAAGVPVRVDALHEALATARRPHAPKRPRTFAAHRPPVLLPPLASGAQTMRRAPALPPVLDEEPGGFRGTGVGRDDSGRDRVCVAPPAAAARAAPAVIDGIRVELARLAKVQKDYAAAQAQAHAHFLAVRQQAFDVLMRAGQGRASTAGATVGATEVATADLLAAPVATSVAPAVRTPRTFDRRALEIHAGGRISEVFGPAFAGQDGYARQVRMPKPPLLLADRVTDLDAVPNSMGKGAIRTETDVGSQTWYLHQGYMPGGVMVEAGQADLMLISCLGIDRYNRGERVYRLLGCELTYHGDLPRVGDTLRFDIRLDGHAAQGDIRLMFFHYECTNGERKQLTVREGQAGFFTDAELADSAGCLWSPQTQEIVAQPRLDPPRVDCTRHAFARADLEAFARGDAYACFGPGFELARTHTRSPSIHDGRMLLLDRVAACDARGGPWGRGYLRAELDITPDRWFFDGHFHNDPCMPGTLMLDGCLQALAFQLAFRGHTLERDGWRFQPVPEIPYKLQCRGQVIPTSRLLVTEVFVEEVVAGPVPTIYADLLCTVDGLKAFHARRLALQLVPDWPMRDGDVADDGRPVAVVDGFRFDHESLLACAYGRPSRAFGPMYERFDGPMRVARLPSPPYHFMSRIAEIDGPIGVMKAGARVVAEYDVPDDAWYFAQNGTRTMPFAVLLEAVLQPCGWLSSYVGSALTSDTELAFRNLDGNGAVHAEIVPGAGTLRTEVTLTNVSASAGMIIESFAVRCTLGGRDVYTLDTVFGFFPGEALASQAGLPTTDADRELLARASNVELDAAGFAERASDARVAGAMLRMIDRVDGLWPAHGGAGLGQLRAYKRVDPGEWFFKAHFFQDPVQPGSLGLEAMLQTLQCFMLAQRMDEGIANPRFETLATGTPHRWKYRGQVLPGHGVVHVTLEVTAAGRDARGAFAAADASLWVDGKRIYEAKGLAARLVATPVHSAEER